MNIFRDFIPWWRWWDSNPWPPACRAGALPAELHPHIMVGSYLHLLVGPSGLEPPTSCLSGTRSNLLSYEPMWLVWLSHLGLFRIGERFYPFPVLCQHWTIFPCSFPQSIFATAELNFCVRNGNRWTLCVCNTDFFKDTWSLKIEQHLVSREISLSFDLRQSSFLFFHELHSITSRYTVRSP